MREQLQEMKEDMKEMKDDIRGLLGRRREFEDHNMALVEKLVMDCGKSTMRG